MWQAKEKRTPKQQVSLSCSYARAEVEKLVEKIELEEIPPIHFDFDKATLKGYSKKTLKMIAGILKRYDHVNLDVHGHTDEIGSDEYNLDLSKRRAAAVESFLKKSGVPQGRVKSSGFGATKPLAPNAGDGGRAQNRRVEFFWRESDATE